jgi:TatD DNase family protein
MNSKYRYIDCHSHPHDEKYKKENINIDEVLQNLKNDGGATIAIGTDYKLSIEAVELAKKHENVWATIGVHPADNHAEIWDEENFQELINEDLENQKKTAIKKQSRKIVGIGECGLDYFYFDKKFPTSPNLSLNKERDSEIEQKIKEEKERQKKLFVSQINFAIKNDLPLVIHGRPSKKSMDAYEDILDILEKTTPSNLADLPPLLSEGEYPRIRGHAHFFVGDLEIAKRFLNIGFLLSFDGPITFTTEYDEVIKFTPIEKIMIETDSPYAAPAPHRGQVNYPIYVKEIAKKVAQLKNISIEEVLEITKQNTMKLFNLK